VPDGDLAVGRADAHTEEPLGQAEQPVEHARQREVRAQILFAVRVALFAQTLRPIGHVPVNQRLGLAVRARERAQLLELAQRRAVRRAAQLLLQLLHRRDVGRHLGRERELREALEAEQPRLFGAQSEDARDQRRVVELARARARDVRAIERLAQIAAREVLERGHQRGLIERQPPRTELGGGVGLAGRARGLRGLVEGAGGQTGDVAGRAQDEGVRLGGVEHVVREGRLQLRELGQDRVETLLGCSLEANSCEHRVAHEHVDDAPLRGLE